MKKIFTAFSFFILCPLIHFAQSPNILITPSVLQDTFAIGDVKVEAFTIKNVGTRDLDFNNLVGQIVSFSKVDFADWTLKENQDSIASNVIITRADSRGIFNIAQESVAEPSCGSNSPIGTEWAVGKTEDVNPANYTKWITAVTCGPPTVLGQTLSMHIKNSSRYFDIVFNEWTEGAGGGVSPGGGFSYTRQEIFDWLSIDIPNGTLLPGASVDITVIIDGSDLVAGDQVGVITINSNDPSKPSVELPVEVHVTGGQPTIVVDPTTLNFGNVVINEEKILQLEIENTGSGYLNVSDISITGTAFVADQNSLDIAPMGKEVVNVTFTPTAEESYAETLTITSNDIANPTVNVSLSGQGILPPDISVSLTDLTETLAVGEVKNQIFTITNNGTADLTWNFAHPYVSEVVFSKTAFSDFNLEANQDRITPSVSITRANDRGIFNIAKEPSYTKFLSPFDTEWAMGNTVGISGGSYTNWETAAGYKPNLPGNTMSMHLVSDDKFYDIEWQSWNVGASAGGPGGGGFSYIRKEVPEWVIPGFIDFSEGEGTLGAGQSVDITVSIDGNEAGGGTYEGELFVESNDPDQPTINVPVNITVTGGTPEISLTPVSLDFGGILIGEEANLEFSVFNNGDSTLIINSIATNLSVYTTDSTSLVVLPDRSKKVVVSFVPADNVNYKDSVFLYSNDPNTPVAKLPLNGDGLQLPQITVDQTLVDAGAIESGNSTNRSIMIENTGGGDLTWSIESQYVSEVTFTKANFADWTLSENQDRISSEIWITRADENSIFNIFAEDIPEPGCASTAPFGTGWAVGKTVDLSPGDYSSFLTIVGCNPSSALFADLSLWLVLENRKFDVVFSQWSTNGGGLSYTRREFPAWLTYSTTGGTLASGESIMVDLTFSAVGKDAGDYPADFKIISNDTSNPEVLVNTLFSVTGQPAIAVNPPVINFSDTYLSYSDSVELEIMNTGNDTLFVTGATISDPVFSITDSTLTILPGGTAYIWGIFTPLLGQAYAGTIELSNNDPVNSTYTISVSGTGLVAPNMSLNTTEFNVQLFTGETSVEPLTIGNSGGEDLLWRFDIDLDKAFENLNQNYQRVLDSIPAYYTFAYDGDNSSILNGGDNMYNTGNYLLTNYTASPIAYSDSIIRSGNGLFGAGTRYFTRHLPGLFVLAAELNGVTTFNTNGGLGTSGLGTAEGDVLEITKYGRTFQAFLKRVYGAGTVPSVNHLVILEKKAGLSQTFSPVTSSDYHQVFNMGNNDFLYCLVYGGTNGSLIDSPTAAKIFEAFLDAIYGDGVIAPWLSIDNSDGIVTSGSSDNVNFSFDPAGLPGGEYAEQLLLTSNDPNQLSVIINAYLQVGGIKVINPIADQLETEGFGSSDFDISNVFENVDAGATTSYTVGTDDPNILVATLTGNIMTVSETGTGTTNVSIRAEDNNGYVAFDDFDFRVNANPKEANPIEDQFENEGFATVDIDVSGVFIDVDGDPLTLSAVNSNDAVATIDLVGTILTVTEVSRGSTSIELTAVDGLGGSGSSTFSFTVNGEPVVDNPFTDPINVSQGYGTVDVDLTGVFSDPDGDVLTYAASIDPDTVADVSVSGNTLTISETAYGSGIITITAEDGKGGMVSTPLTLNVNGNPLVDPIGNILEQEGFVTRDIDLAGVFTDPEGAPLTFSLEGNSDPAVAGASLSGSLLTISEVSFGSTDITVSADDGNGGSAVDMFTFSINSWPYADNPIADQVANTGFGSFSIDLDTVFVDDDGDLLSYTDSVSDPGVVTTTLVGSLLTVNEVSTGTADIFVYAADGRGGYASDTFAILANSPPIVIGVIPDPKILQEGDDYEVWLDTVFVDPEGFPLIYTAISEMGVFFPTLVEDTLLQIISPVPGSADEITITATDVAGLSADLTFTLEVNSKPLVNPINLDTVLNEGFGTYLIGLDTIFSDPDGDALVYFSNSEDEGVVTVNATGTPLTITEIGLGTVNITLSARDARGGIANKLMLIKVNGAPVAKQDVYELILVQNQVPLEVFMDTLFTDPNMDALTYLVDNDNPGLVLADATGSNLDMTYRGGQGDANIRVIGSDGYAEDTTYLHVQVIITGIEDGLNLDLKVFPNPAKDVVTLRSDQFEGQEVTVDVIDLNGKRLIHQRFENAGKELQMNLNGIAAGVYTLLISSDDFQGIGKVLLE